MKNEKKLKGYETVWTCDFCDKEFETKKESDKHELTCKKNPKNNEIVFRIKKPNSSTIFGWASLFIFIYFIVYVVANANAQNNGLPIRDLLQPQKWFPADVKNEITPTPTPTIITTPTPTPTLVPKKIIKPTSIPIDTDPMINCNISTNCGGGTRKIKQSECNNGTCCQIGSSWIFYTSKQKCTEDQNKYNSNYTYPTYAPYPTYKPIPTYSYSTPTPYVTPTLTESQAQAIIDQYNAQVTACRSEVNSNYNQKVQNCNIQFGGSSAAEACTYAVNKERDSALASCGQTY